jgi:phage recombination protein Bet
MTPTQLVAKQPESKFTEYVPFGAQDKLKLSIEMVKNLIAVKTKIGKTCSDQDAIKFIAKCQAMRLNPFEEDCFLIGYDTKEGPQFSFVTAHKAFLKRAELNPEYDGMKSGVIVKRDGQVLDLEGDFFMDGDEVIGGWAVVHFKNRKEPMRKRIRLQRFKKSYGIWLEDSAGMICKCAEADALRSSFPTMLGGLYLREEVQPAEVKTSAPIFTSPTKEIESVGITDKGPTELDRLRLLCASDKIADSELLSFLKDIGLAEEDADSLDEVHAKNDTAIGTVTEQWTDIASRIIEGRNK